MVKRTDITSISEDIYFNRLGKIVDAICKKNGTEDYENKATNYYEALLEVKDAILSKPGETLQAIADGTVDETKLPKTYAECLDAIICAIGGTEWNNEKKLLACLGAIPASTDLLGKKAYDLATAIEIHENGSIAGKLNYVTNYTGFNSANTEEQEGYFFPFYFTTSDDVTEASFKVFAKEKKGLNLVYGPVKCDPENIAFLGHTVKEACNKEVVVSAVRADGVEELIYLDMNDLQYGPRKSKVGSHVWLAEVNTVEALKAAIANPDVREIKIVSPMEIGETINVNRSVRFNGGNNQITFTVSGKNFVFSADGTTIENLIMTNNQEDPATWASNYGIQIYKAKNVTIKDVKISGCNAAIFVNSSDVVFDKAINVSNNGFGGVEVSKSSSSGLPDPKLTILTPITNVTEEYKKPTVWTYSTDFFVEDKTGMTVVEIGGQQQYYNDKVNTVVPAEDTAEETTPETDEEVTV